MQPRKVAAEHDGLAAGREFVSAGADPADAVVDPLTGIVRWISEIPLEPGEPEIFNYSVKMCDSIRMFPVGCYDRNGGAGLSREAAYRAAVGEAIERYCSSVYFPDELTLATYRFMSGRGRACGPAEMALFHPDQQIRYSIFTEDTPLCWTEGVSLTNGTEVFIPACLTFVPYYPFHRARGEETIGPSITTGQACAFAFDDACVRGLYEIIERDAFAITWLHRLRIPRIDPTSSPRIQNELEQRFARHGLKYTLHALPTDVGVPSILCVLVDENHTPPLVCTGGASSLDAESAALKALVEAAQTREWAKYLGLRSSPFVFESDFSNVNDFDKHVLLYAYGDMLSAVDFLVNSPDAITFADLRSPQVRSRQTELTLLVDFLREAGCEAFCVDMTTEDVAACGYRVVKMVVPQMQQLEGDHTHRLLGSARLFSVPKKLGYAVSDSIDALNPDPHPYP